MKNPCLLTIRPLAAGLLLALSAMAAQADPISPAPALPEPVDALALQSASADVQRVAHWVADSRDNAGMPYVLIDKVNARVYAFDASGQLRGSAPALLGMARGDRLLASNDTQVNDVQPDQRITPAGRFVSRLAIDSHGEELLVIDYAASISLHAVVKGTPEERRAERLSSATSADNRISYGCINVPKLFYATVVSPTFAHTKGVVYILPETRPVTSVFAMAPATLAASPSQAGASSYTNAGTRTASAN